MLQRDGGAPRTAAVMSVIRPACRAVLASARIARMTTAMASAARSAAAASAVSTPARAARPATVVASAARLAAAAASAVTVSLVVLAAPAAARDPSPVSPSLDTSSPAAVTPNPIAPSSSASPNPNLGPSLAGVAMCTISDPQITAISGLVATTSGYVVINDASTDRSRQRIFFLDRQCGLVRSVGYPGNAFDAEDLAVTEDGTLWIADVGDNTTLVGGSGNRRSSIALWSLAPGSNTPVIHRLAYPDGRARDAEALLIDGQGMPVIVTKDPAGEVYTINEPLPANNANPAPLTRAGTFKPQATGTANPYGILGTGVVTGAAMSPDGKRAVVRTMSDAYEYDITDGDVAAAITSGTPRITPLPNEPQGESIAYTTDGSEYLTVSDQPKPSAILRYTPYQPPAPPSASPAPAAAAPRPASHRSFLDSLSLRDITNIVTGIGLLGLLMVVVGVAAVIRSRRIRRRALLGSQQAAEVPAQGTGSQSAADGADSSSPAGGSDTSSATSAGESAAPLAGDASGVTAPETSSTPAARPAPPSEETTSTNA